MQMGRLYLVSWLVSGGYATVIEKIDLEITQ